MISLHFNKYTERKRHFKSVFNRRTHSYYAEPFPFPDRQIESSNKRWYFQLYHLQQSLAPASGTSFFQKYFHNDQRPRNENKIVLAKEFQCVNLLDQRLIVRPMFPFLPYLQHISHAKSVPFCRVISLIFHENSFLFVANLSMTYWLLTLIL